jgi:predicted lactoylglutathione lyase
VKQRVNLVTLGTEDLASARRFYEALGWTTNAAPDDDVVFFQAGETVVALWDRARLAEDSCVEDGGGWGGVTMALNFASPEEVEAVIEEARAAGARIGREPAETFWGGYSGIFVDPDGHPWRSPTTRTGPSPRTAASASAEPARGDRLAGQPGPPASR